MNFRIAITALGSAAMLAWAVPSLAHEPGDKITPNFEQGIPNIPGKSLVAVEVDYPPGGTSLPHVHAKPKANAAETRIYNAGQSWSEPPGASHPVSRNASKTKPAKLLAIFVVDTDDKELTTFK